MAIRIVAKFRRSNGDVLRICRNWSGLRGSVFGKNGKKAMSAMFYDKDKDASVFRVREYFGFLGDDVNEIQIN